MLLEVILKQELWKTILSAVPALALIFKAMQSLFQYIKNGKLIQYRHFYKEYGEHLSKEDKMFISKQLRKKIMSQLTGVKDDNKINMLVYVTNRCELKVTASKLAMLSNYLCFNGSYFYFKVNKRYACKRYVSWVTGVIYLSYGLAPIKYYHDVDLFRLVPVPGLIILSTFSIIFALFLLKAYPSWRKIQGVNGRMINADGSQFNKSRLGNIEQ